MKLLSGTSALAVLAAAAPATAATTLGQTFSPPFVCAGEYFQSSLAAGITAAPTPGVITSWSYESGANPSTLTLRVYRPAATAGEFTSTAEDSPLKDIPATGGLNTFNTRIPVQAGDLIGLRVEAGLCGATGVVGDVVRAAPVSPIGTAGPYFAAPGTILDVSAQLEPDADGDGYGDETQDACPGEATSQSPGCVDPNDATPPDTTISQGPANKIRKRKVTFSFTATEELGTFYCKLRGRGVAPGVRQFRSCASPKTYRGLDRGRYEFSVAAADFWRNLDPTPAERTFKVRR